MNNNHLFSLFLIISANSYSQPVSIELSIEWKHNMHYKKYRVSDIPFLKITYRNKSDSPLYFFKMAKSKTVFPNIMMGRNMNFSKKEIKYLKHIFDYSKGQYVVSLAGPPFKNLKWEILPDSVNPKSPHEISGINDFVSGVYSYLSKNKFNLGEEPPLDFTETDIDEKGIFGKLKDSFVFLDIVGEYAESYNLIGFQLVGGNFSFSIDLDTLSNFVYADPYWDELKHHWEYKIIELPSKVDKYSLYSGTFSSNKVLLVPQKRL